MTEPKRTVHVRSHHRDGHHVRAHSRRLNWKSVGATWAVTGFSALTTLGMLATFGIELISMSLVILTALLTLLAVWVTTKSTEKQRKMRARTAPARRRKGTGRRPATTRSRTRR